MLNSPARNTTRTAISGVRQVTESACTRDTLWAALTVAQGNAQLLRRAIAQGKTLNPAEVDRRLATIEVATAKAARGAHELEARTS